MKKRTFQEYKWKDPGKDKPFAGKKQRTDRSSRKGPSYNRKDGESCSGDQLQSVCLWCEEEFEDLDAHRVQSKACQPYICQYCGSLFASVEALGSHRNFHPGFPATSLVCVECDKKFMTTGNYQTTSLSDNPYSRTTTNAYLGLCFCTPCRRTKIINRGKKRQLIYKSPSIAVTTSVPQNMLQRLLCPFCSGKFVNLSALVYHCSDHKEYFLYGYPCNTCEAKFSSLESLENHLSFHEAGKVYLCDVCGVKMRNESIRDNHREGHIRSSTLSDIMDIKKNNNYVPFQPVSFRPPTEYFADMINNALQKRSIMLCEKCNFATKDVAELREHKRNHDSEHLPWSQSGDLRKNVSNTPYVEEPSNRGSEKARGYIDSQKKHPAASSWNSPMEPPSEGIGGHRISQGFKCPFCSKPSRDLFTLFDHCRVHPEYIFHKIACEICGKECPSVKILSLHVSRHENRNVFLCPACGERFFSSAAWNFHITKHMEIGDLHECLSRKTNPRFNEKTIKLFKCDRCSDAYESEKELKGHLHQRHSFPCQFCDKVFMVGHALVTHLQRHELYMFHKFKCTACDELCESFFALEKHIGDHQHRKLFLCGICGATFAVVKEREDHIESHRGEPISGEKIRLRDLKGPKVIESRIACCVCGALYNNKRQYAVHVNDDHRLPFVCQYCNEAFSSTNGLSAHCHRHEEYPLRGFRCVLCIKRFISLETLEDHLSTAHEERRIFLCCLCGEKFYDKEDRLQHELQHGMNNNGDREEMPTQYGTSSNQYPCNECDTKFANVEMLKTHINSVHIPFGCNKCPSRFRSKEERHRHSANEHNRGFSQEAPPTKLRNTYSNKRAIEPKKQILIDPPPPQLSQFECSLCGKTFGSKEGKEYHEKNHKKNC